MVMSKKLAALLLVGTLGLSQAVFALEDGEISDLEENSQAPSSKADASQKEDAKEEAPKTKAKLFSKFAKKNVKFYAFHKYTKIGSAVVVTAAILNTKTARKYANKVLVAVGLSSEETRNADFDEELEA